jgi:hypothetical protein
MDVTGQLHTLAAERPPPPPYLLDRRLCGSQSQSELSGDEKNSQLLPGLEPPVIQSVAQRYTIELSRLLASWRYNNGRPEPHVKKFV